MATVLWLVLLWFVRVVSVLLVVGTLVPFVRTGSWLVRVWDFPRLQIAAACAVALVALVCCVWRFGWRAELWVGVALVSGAMIWQSGQVLPYTRFWPKQLADAPASGLRVAILNLQYDNPNRDAAVEAIERLEADAVLLIELDEHWARALEGYRGRFAHHVDHVRGEGLGLALWTNLDVESAEIRHLVSEDRASIHADLRLGDGTPVRFIGLHPVPPALDKDDGGRYDSRIRDSELMKVANAVEENPDHHWVIAGDFNDVAWSHTTRLFQRVSGLGDPRIGRALLSTYHAQRPLLRYPLDHVFVSHSFGVASLDRVRVPGSDHFGVLAQIAIIDHTHPGNTGSDNTSSGSAPDADSDDEREAEEMIEEGENDARENGESAP